MRTNIKNQIAQYERGIFVDSNNEVDMKCCNFYDWFCKDSSLENRAHKLYAALKRFLKHHPEIDQETHYVFFKNNAPMCGTTYDDFRICDVEMGDVMWTVIPRKARTEKVSYHTTRTISSCEVYTRPFHPAGFYHNIGMKCIFEGKNLSEYYKTSTIGQN